ncbi:MAG TPA: LysR family transcriptional regulator [Bauldia sp.]|nr:LysR family transcriptional regulator [Bauldia sp.]
MLDPLTLDQLRVLVAVAETGSFSAAARKLGRVQSAISQAVQSLETALGTTVFDRSGKVPQLNDAGRVLLNDARVVIRTADALKARAESIAADVEPELTLAVDALFPNHVLIESLRALTGVYPCLPVTVFTEGVGGAEQRLRDGSARLGLMIPFPGISDDRDSEFLVNIPMVPVVAASHPLAAEPAPVSRAVLERQVQLVLTDRTPLTNGISGGIVSFRTWRFADLGTRLEFLLAGFGWCNMPVHLVREHILAGRLKVLELSDPPRRAAEIHVVHARGRPPGKAGRWLIEAIRERLPQCVGPLSLPQVPWVSVMAEPSPALMDTI